MNEENNTIKTLKDHNWFEYFGLEPLEERTVYTAYKFYIAIHPTEGRNFSTNPYLKISWRSDFDDNSVARISMKTGKYVFHNGKTAVVPQGVLHRLNEILQSSPDTERADYIGLTCWDRLIKDISLMYGKDFEQLRSEIVFKPFTNLGPIPDNITKYRWGGDGKVVR